MTLMQAIDKWRHLLMLTYAAAVVRFAWHYVYNWL